MFGMFSKERGCLFFLDMRIVSAHCVFPQMGRPSARAPGTTHFEYDMSVSYECAMYRDICSDIPSWLLFFISDLGLRIKAEDNMVDGATEDTQTFLIASVQSRK